MKLITTNIIKILYYLIILIVFAFLIYFLADIFMVKWNEHWKMKHDISEESVKECWAEYKRSESRCSEKVREIWRQWEQEKLELTKKVTKCKK